jgi:hypothetical protein
MSMKTLTKIAAPIAIAIASLSVAGVAQAQPWGGSQKQSWGQNANQRGPQGWNLTPARSGEIRQDISSLNNAINRAAQRRTISTREATTLRRQANDVRRLYAQYQRNGLTRAEVRNLESRVNSVRIALRMERRDWDGRRG